MYLLVEETGETHRPAASGWQILSHNVVSSTPCLSGNRTPNFDYIDVKIVQMQVIPLKIMLEQNKYFRPNRSTIITHTRSPTIFFFFIVLYSLLTAW
jgi:hypothetical protein